MKEPITTAVILAAGLGSRLGERTKAMPKAFLSINGETLIQRSIETLLEKGIKKIIIGTGYLNGNFDALKVQYPMIETCRNEEYATTGSMHTLYNLRKLITHDFLLLEADLLYEKAALQHILEDNHSDTILASGTTYSNDEVYLEANEEWKLVNMSKNKNELTHISGELVGINKISYPTLQLMCQKDDRSMHYEDSFVSISKIVPIHILKVEGLAWCEIDDEQHLERATNLIYPKIEERNNKHT